MDSDGPLRLKPRGLGEAASQSDWRALLRTPWVWAAIVSCALLIGRCVADTFTVFNRDEGAFLTIAQEILHGRVPYRDVFDHKGPATYYLLAGALALTSRLSITTQVFVVRLLAVFTNLVTAVGIGILGKRWWRLEVGVLAVLLWLFTLPLYLGDDVLTEPFATAPVVWAVVLAAQRSDARSACYAGLLIALGSLFKQTAVLAAPGVALLLLAQIATGNAWWPINFRQGATVTVLALGMALPWLVVCALFASAGALQPMISQVVGANIHYPPDSFEAVIGGILLAIKANPIIPLVPPLVIGVGLVRWLCRPGRAAHVPSLGAIAATIIGVFNLLPFFSHAFLHYWLPVAPWAVLLTALCSMAIFEWARPHIRVSLSRMRLLSGTCEGQRRVKLQVLLVLLLALAVLAGMNRTLVMFQARSTLLRPQIAAGAWIAHFTPPEARLLVGPAEPEYYYLSGRLPVTFYIYLLPVNLSPTLLAQVVDQLQTEQFDRIVWREPYDISTNPANREIYQQLTAHYQRIATYDMTAASAPAQLVLYAPDRSGAETGT